MASRPISKLCSHCGSIDFSMMNLPFVSEVEDLWQGVEPTSSGFFQRDMTSVHNTTFQLGTVRRLLDSSKNCKLCRIFSDVIATRTEIPGSRMNQVRPLENDGLVCWAEYAPLREFGNFGARIFGLNLCVGNDYDETSLARAWACLSTSQVYSIQTRRVAAENGAAPPLFYSNRIRPSQLDSKVLRGWMNLCQNEHQLTCGQPTQPHKHEKRVKNSLLAVPASPDAAILRLINVERRCIIVVKPEDGHKYVALSYVWGGLQHPTDIRTNNVDALQKPGSLPDEALCQTVADFLQLASTLEIPYAWVDALCVLQDDGQDMAIQIASMRRIYNNAFMTVINASGDNLNAGLCGVRAGSRPMLQEEITVPLRSGPKTTAETNPETITLMTTLSRTNAMHRTRDESSIWFTRAWTYQERLLSARVLIFTPEQILWICPGARFSEENLAECEQDFVRPIAFDPTIDVTLPREATDDQDDMNEVWRQYASYVRAYSGRDLSYPGDIYNAFCGIEQNVSQRTGDQIVWGLPASQFDLALGWDTFDILDTKGLKRRTAYSTSKVPPQMLQIFFPSWSWMGWIGRISMTTFIQQEAGHAAAIRSHIHQTTPRLCIRSVSNASQDNNDKNDQVTIEMVCHQYPHLTRERLEQIPDRTVLFFWSETSHLKIRHPSSALDDPPANADSKPGLAILDQHGEKVGECCFTAADEPQTMASAEFVVISTHRDQYSDAYGTFAEVRVLQIQEQAADKQVIKVEGLYERVNIGLISQSAWIASKPQRKLIALG